MMGTGYIDGLLDYCLFIFFDFTLFGWLCLSLSVEEEGRGVCNGKSCLSSQPALFNYGLFPLDFMYRQQLYLNELG